MTSSLSITAGTITTSGLDAGGIMATANYGALTIDVGSISTKGHESTGIIAFGGRDITMNVGSINGYATGIYAIESGTGTIALDVTGKVSSSAGTMPSS